MAPMASSESRASSSSWSWMPAARARHRSAGMLNADSSDRSAATTISLLSPTIGALRAPKTGAENVPALASPRRAEGELIRRRTGLEPGEPSPPPGAGGREDSVRCRPRSPMIRVMVAAFGSPLSRVCSSSGLSHPTIDTARLRSSFSRSLVSCSCAFSHSACSERSVCIFIGGTVAPGESSHAIGEVDMSIIDCCERRDAPPSSWDVRSPRGVRTLPHENIVTSTRRAVRPRVAGATG
jgi:hypothetical protein